jgi:hypothetical protein
MSHNKSRLERLPPELKYYIAEYVECKDQKPYPYISLFKDIIIDWYNKYRAWDNSGIVYCEYNEIYTKGISADETPFLKCAFKRYRQESKYYNIIMVHSVGQFQKIACRRRNLSWNGRQYK